MKKIIAETVGWCGAGAILLAYGLVSFEYISPDTAMFQILNGLGAVGVVYVSYRKRAFQPATLNVVWAIIAFVTLLRFW